MERVEKNPYAAPAVPTAPLAPGAEGPLDLDAELAETKMNFFVRAGAVAAAVTGAVLLFAGLQLWGAVRLDGVWELIPWGMLGVGALQIVLGVKIYRQRVWAATAVTALGGLLALAAVVWFVMATSSGFISLLALMTPFTEAGAAIMAGLALPSCRRAAAARKRLAADGLDVDF